MIMGFDTVRSGIGHVATGALTAFVRPRRTVDLYRA